MSLDEFLGFRTLRSNIRIGTSGWDYDDWIGPFYESDRGMLSSYVKFFDTVEVNSSFYTILSGKLYEGLASVAPPSFLFSVKMYKGITHKKILNPKLVEAELDSFFNSIQPLVVKGKLGAVLVQLPPRSRGELPWLEEFIASLPEKIRVAIEFRDQSWLENEVFSMLRKYGVAYVVVDEPLLPPIIELTADFLYVRWHGRGERPWYYYRYTMDELRLWAEKLKDIIDHVELLLGYFNNHFRGFAPYNALQMLVLLGIAERRHKELLARMDKYFATAPPLKPDILESLKGGEVEETLRALAGERRFQRGLEISGSEVVYSLTERGLIARVKEYRIEVDRVEKKIIHDCEDWRKSSESKRFCKHVVKLFLSLPREVSKELLEDLLSSFDEWSFEY
ncbi:MAG: DUF72 domain-containing protein [Sulfolobales archaeon]